ncbi:MAG: hypothetical protein RLZZ366_2096 [Pseudomonadota bacterium]|jgi:N-6 DNA Methylase
MSEAATLEYRPIAWLEQLKPDFDGAGVDGLVPVQGFRVLDLSPEQHVMMEKAESYEAHSVFFEAGRNGRPAVAQAFVYVSDQPGECEEFAKLHKRLWSWGGVPLLYRKTPGKVGLFRCASKPDFDQKSETPKYEAYDTLEITADISEAIQSAKPWWDVGRLRNGTLWDDPAICKQLLSDTASAHRHLVDNIFSLYIEIKAGKLLSEELQRRLLILSLLIAYLDERKALEPNYFSQFLEGAESFPDVLRNGPALVNLLKALEDRFNGHVFELDETQRDELLQSQQLGAFADLIAGRHSASGQGSFWRLYSFRDLPVELISNIYQLFVEDKASSIYTPPALVRLMLEEALSWERIDRLIENDEVIFDPACGSAVFLVEAYKRLVLHWRIRNNWQQPKTADLKALLKRVHGVDLEPGAIKLAAFSLCLALCEALTPEHIRKSVKLFPVLEGETLHGKCFFLAVEEGLISNRVGVVVGNPPFKSPPSTSAAIRAADNYKEKHGAVLPDKQLAYLFLVNAMGLLADGGIMSMIQPAGFLYNLNPEVLRRKFLDSWDVREILDFVSVRGLFGDADTKIVVVVAIAGNPKPSRKLLHAVFRRSGKADAEQGFDIDYYDMHWMSREVLVKNTDIWRANLLGGGRVLSFIERLRRYPTLSDYAASRGWTFGQGYIAGKKGISNEANHIVGKPLLPTQALNKNGLDRNSITVVPDTPIKDPRPAAQFTPPFLLIKAHEDFYKHLWTEYYLTFKDKLLGLAAPEKDIKELKQVESWLSREAKALKAFCAGTSISSFSRKATALANKDVKSLPYPTGGYLDISPSEEIIADDIVRYQRDIVRRGDKSDALKNSGHSALPAFNETFLAPINGIYTDNPLIVHPAKIWPGIICQPYSFGEVETDLSDTEKLRGRLDVLLKEQTSPTLSVTRIARIYDGNMLYLIKPDRLRFWLRSIALRDADEVLADLRAQGY